MASHTRSKCFKSSLLCLWHQSLSSVSKQDHICTWTSSNKRLKAVQRHGVPSISTEAFLLFASCPFLPFLLGSGPENPVLGSFASGIWGPAGARTLHLMRLMKETASPWGCVPCPDLGCSLPFPLPLHSPVSMTEQWKGAPGRDLCWFCMR